VAAPAKRPARPHSRLLAPVAIAVGAVVLRALSGVGFANYDTLYALVWGQQLARGETPRYGIPIAPTPHPLVEAVGFVLSPLGPSAMEDVTVALGFLALSACGWVVFRLGSLWFGPAAGALAAVLLLTRVPILSYGVRAYVDVPYLLLVLTAVLVEARSQQADGRPVGAPVLMLLAAAGLLRPEAWAFSGLYWLYLIARPAHRAHAAGGSWDPGRPRGDVVRLTLLAVAAPLIWIAGDWLVTGRPLWSLTNTRATAATLDRATGIGDVPEYIPRRVGEILRPPVLFGAAVGGVLSLLWLPCRARLGATVGVVAVVVFAAFATVGLPINSRYAFPAAAVLCIFCGAGAFGWVNLPPGDRRRRWWTAAGVAVLAALVAYVPAQYRLVHRQLTALARQQRAQDDLVALVDDGTISTRCLPIGVPNHAPIPLLALWLKTSPSHVVSAQVRPIRRGTYVDPATREVQDDYVLDLRDPHLPVTVPAGFALVRVNRSWRVFERCE